MTAEPQVEQWRPCRDSECEGLAFPEQDGETLYWACSACGYEFGWQQQAQTEGSCSLGISEETRRSMGAAIPSESPKVFMPMPEVRRG